jgi:hypothetical protein
MNPFMGGDQDPIAGIENFLSGLLIPACVVILILSLSFPWARRIVFSIISFLAGVVLLIFSLWSMIFWIPTSLIFRRFIPATLIAIFFEGLLKIIGRLSSDPLMRGDRVRVARSMWPESKFGFLYKEVAADLRRPLLEDGKLVGGFPATWLSDRYVTEAIPRSIVEIGILSFLEIFIPALLYCIISGLWEFFEEIDSFAHFPTPMVERFPGAAVQTVDAFAWYSVVAKAVFNYLWSILYYNTVILIDWAFLALGVALILIPAARQST